MRTHSCACCGKGQGMKTTITSMPAAEEGNSETPTRNTSQYSGEGQQMETYGSRSAHENLNHLPVGHNEREQSPAARVLAKIQRYDTASNGWKLASTLRQQEKKQGPFEIALRRGGAIKLFANLLAKETSCQVRDELFHSGMFRQYQNQSVDEPRCLMLLHEDATNRFEAKQPGYRYNNTTLKSRPLQRFQELKKLSKEMAALCNVDKWTIGVNPVLYRDGKDRMGDHADDSQGETLILAVLVDSPTEARRVVVRPFSTLELEDGDEKIELFMQQGDAYSMDGPMQKSYSHCVPRRADRHASEGSHRRLAIIFRTGTEIWFQHDSGQPCPNLAPREKSTLVLGNRDLELIEGECYARMEMYRTGAHRFLQRGVSGNKEDGCDAIVVSGKREDNLGEDHFEKLYYVADSKTGALALLTSYEKSQRVRVFRSSDYLNAYRAPKPKVVTSTMYRYDGLYCIRRVVHPPERKRKQPHTFVFERQNPPFNEIHCREYREHCERQNTLLAPNYREFLLWWDGSGNPELLRDREALYSHFGKRSLVDFRSSRSKQLAQTFFEFGMEELLLQYDQLRPLMESNPEVRDPPTVCGDNDCARERTSKAPLQVPLEVRKSSAALPATSETAVLAPGKTGASQGLIVPKTRKVSRHARRLPPRRAVGVKEPPKKKKRMKPNRHPSHLCSTNGSPEQSHSMKPNYRLPTVAPHTPEAKTQTAGIRDRQVEKNEWVVIFAAPAPIGRRGNGKAPSPGGLLRNLLKRATGNENRDGRRQTFQKGNVQGLQKGLIGVKYQQ